MNKTYRSLCLLILVVPFCGHAARFYVSGSGNDGNACTRTAPCASFQRALAVASSGDEIDAIDAGDFGGVNISFPITIDGGRDGWAEDISVSTGGNVTIRNLSIEAIAYGISTFADGVNLRMEHISVIGSGFNFGIVCQNGTCLADDVHVTGAIKAAVIGGDTGVKLSISNSVMADSTVGLATAYSGIVQADNCIIRLNTVGVSTNDNFNYATAGTIRLSNTTVTDNAAGLQVAGTGASIVTFGNNRIYGNEAKVNPATGNPTTSVSVR